MRPRDRIVRARIIRAGRVPVYDLQSDLSDPLKALQREEPAPETLFEARRQAERSATSPRPSSNPKATTSAEVEPFAEGVERIQPRRARHARPAASATSRASIDYLDAPPDETTRVELESLLAPLDAGIAGARAARDRNRRRLVARLRKAGYPDAKADPVDALADAETGEVELTFRVRPGLRASFGDLRVTGLVAPIRSSSRTFARGPMASA
jgi:outer membrane translocation and assembly module TamA